MATIEPLIIMVLGGDGGVRTVAEEVESWAKMSICRNHEKCR